MSSWPKMPQQVPFNPAPQPQPRVMTEEEKERIRALMGGASEFAMKYSPFGSFVRSGQSQQAAAPQEAARPSGYPLRSDMGAIPPLGPQRPQNYQQPGRPDVQSAPSDGPVIYNGPDLAGSEEDNAKYRRHQMMQQIAQANPWLFTQGNMVSQRGTDAQDRLNAMVAGQRSQAFNTLFGQGLQNEGYAESQRIQDEGADRRAKMEADLRSQLQERTGAQNKEIEELRLKNAPRLQLMGRPDLSLDEARKMAAGDAGPQQPGDIAPPSLLPADFEDIASKGDIAAAIRKMSGRQMDPAGYAGAISHMQKYKSKEDLIRAITAALAERAGGSRSIPLFRLQERLGPISPTRIGDFNISQGDDMGYSIEGPGFKGQHSEASTLFPPMYRTQASAEANSKEAQTAAALLRAILGKQAQP